MSFSVRMRIPEIQELWSDLRQKSRSGSIKKTEKQLYKKWGNALKRLSENPTHPGLQTHEISSLSKRYGIALVQLNIKIIA